MKLLLLSSLLASLVSRCPAPLIDRELEERVDKIYGDIDKVDPKKARDKEYFRYLLRVTHVIFKDEAFKKREKEFGRKNIAEEKFVAGLYEELSPKSKEKLDNLKLAEIEFQEKLKAADKTHMLDKTDNEWNPIHQTDKKFSQSDIDLLLGRYKSMIAIKDAKRREKFNEHEMKKELEYRESLQNAKSDEDRKSLMEKEKLHHEKKHERLHDPLSGPQLREIWNRRDGLDPEYFDLKTLFKLHDKNGDGHLDEFELETLFLSDLDKAYKPDDPDVDLAERDEELERMKETALQHIDTDGDGKVSLNEVLAAKATSDYEKDKEYKPLYEGGHEFTEDELRDYKIDLANHQGSDEKEAVKET